MDPNRSCVAGILAGGSSLRIGRPKALMVLADGSTLIERVVDVARAVSHDLVLLGATIRMPPALEHIEILPDAKPGGGPLAGLCSLLGHARDRWALLLACDMPNLKPDLLERMLTAACETTDAVVFERPETPGSYHACCALYHPRILGVAQTELFEGRGSIQNVLALVRTTALQSSPEQIRQLTNINTLKDCEDILGADS